MDSWEQESKPYSRLALFPHRVGHGSGDSCCKHGSRNSLSASQTDRLNTNGLGLKHGVENTMSMRRISSHSPVVEAHPCPRLLIAVIALACITLLPLSSASASNFFSLSLYAVHYQGLCLLRALQNVSLKYDVFSHYPQQERHWHNRTTRGEIPSYSTGTGKRPSRPLLDFLPFTVR